MKICLLFNFSTLLMSLGIGAAATVAIPLPSPKSPAARMVEAERRPARHIGTKPVDLEKIWAESLSTDQLVKRAAK